LSKSDAGAPKSYTTCKTTKKRMRKKKINNSGNETPTTKPTLGNAGRVNNAPPKRGIF